MLKVELPFSYKKKFRLKSLNTRVFLRTILQETINLLSSYTTYVDFYPAIFLHRVDSVSSFYWRK